MRSPEPNFPVLVLTYHVDHVVMADSPHPEQRDGQLGSLDNPPAVGPSLQDLRAGCQAPQSPATSHQVGLNRKIFRTNFKY